MFLKNSFALKLVHFTILSEDDSIAKCTVLSEYKGGAIFVSVFPSTCNIVDVDFGLPESPNSKLKASFSRNSVSLKAPIL